MSDLVRRKDNRPNICFNCEHCCALTADSDGDVKVMCNLGVENCDKQRPQGEWARHDEWRDGEYIGGFYHVNCPCEDGYYSKWRTNFCPNCGLPMQKGGAT